MRWGKLASLLRGKFVLPRRGSAGRRNLLVLGVVLVILTGGGAAGAYWFFSGQGSATVTEPMSGSTTATFNSDLAPGNASSMQFELENSPSGSDYVVLTKLEQYTDGDGSGLENARQRSSGYISNFTVQGSDYTFDLLNDGEAYYEKIESGTLANGSVSVNVPDDTRASSQISLELATRRAADRAPSGSVEMHREFSAEDCASCHSGAEVENQYGNVTGASIHDGLAVNDSCRSCHGRSAQDVHSDCNAACHGDYPIEAGVMGHSRGSEIESEYYCSNTGCHAGAKGQGYAVSHVRMNGPLCANSGCHGQENDIMTMHDRPAFEGSDCVDCHGLEATGIHKNYQNEDCDACHGGLNYGNGSIANLGSFHENVTDCSTCHQSSNPKLVHDGTTRDCQICHNSSTVTVGIMDHTSSESTCTDCHTNGGSVDLGSLHTNPGSCTNCHSTSDLQQIHEGTNLACETCHSSSTVTASGHDHTSNDADSCTAGCHDGSYSG